MVSDEQRALWAAIRANPDDDTPRLVYADWLQEHGDEDRAEFIRVQCALEVLGADQRGERGRLEAQLAKLAPHREAWLAPFRERLSGANRRRSDNLWTKGAEFRRGFVDGTNCDLTTAAVMAWAGDNLEPMDRIEVAEMGANYDHSKVAAIAAWPGAGCVTFFSLARATDADPAVITRGHLNNLRHLTLWGGQVSDDGVERLTAWPGAAALDSLDLEDNPQISDAGALALSESPHLTGIKHLNLRGIRFGADALAALRTRFGNALETDS